MNNFRALLQEVDLISGISFSIRDEDNTEIYKSDALLGDSDKTSFGVLLGKTKCIVTIQKKYELCIPLLKYTLINKFNDLISSKEQLLIDLLQKEEIPLDRLENNIPFLNRGCILFIIKVEGNRYEALNILRQMYSNDDILSSIYADNIVLIGEFDEPEEYAKGIRDSLQSDLYSKCLISYGSRAFNAKDIKISYDQADQCLILSKKFGMKGEILNYNKMIFEKIVYNLNYDVKKELLESLKGKLDRFDSEMINTVEEFIKSGLNISDAAKNLYIHRNTLIYRLDKILKETGYDIRNFKEAATFIIAFLVWKEQN